MRIDLEMSFFDKIDQCPCGYEFKKGEKICRKCGRLKYKMSPLLNQDDSVDSTMKKISESKEFAKKLGAFQLARDKTTR